MNLSFLSFSNLTFTAGVACKIQVQNRQKQSSYKLIFQARFFENQLQINWKKLSNKH